MTATTVAPSEHHSSAPCGVVTLIPSLAADQSGGCVIARHDRLDVLPLMLILSSAPGVRECVGGHVRGPYQ